MNRNLPFLSLSSSATHFRSDIYSVKLGKESRRTLDRLNVNILNLRAAFQSILLHRPHYSSLHSIFFFFFFFFCVLLYVRSSFVRSHVPGRCLAVFILFCFVRTYIKVNTPLVVLPMSLRLFHWFLFHKTATTLSDSFSMLVV